MKKRYNWLTIIGLVFLAGLVGCDPTNTSKQPVARNVKEEAVKPKSGSVYNDEYDVIVIGGEPEGVAAAVSAARNGARTLLVERREDLGGLFTYGMLNYIDVPQGEDGMSVSKGIFQEWHKMVGNGNAFGITEAMEESQPVQI